MPIAGKPSGSSRELRASASKSKSRSKANAIGYEKRQARKATRTNVSTADVYEQIPEKSKRSNLGLDLDHEEAREFGESVGDTGQDQREELTARLVEDEEIAAEDDEEIDSDEAFDETDDENFAGFFSKSRRAAKQKNRVIEIDLHEDEEMVSPSEKSEEEDDEEVGDDDEFLNLVDVLDGKGEQHMDLENEKIEPSRLPFNDVLENGDQSESNVDEDEEEEAPTGEGMDFAPSEDEDIPHALEQLENFVTNLDVTATTKRKALYVAGGADEGRIRKRRLLEEKTEAGEENEFRVRPLGDKLNLEDLLASLDGQSSALQALKKSTTILTSSKVKTLSAPLPQRAQERLDREAAYEQTKQEVDKWSDTMRRIREAEHLSFPLQAQSSGKPSNIELNAKFKPTTDLECSVDNLLKTSKLREEDIYENEETMLKMNTLSVEEIVQRRNNLRQMRELMFRADVKARRVKKIKSKTYRRLRRKEKERLSGLIDERGPEDDSETEEGRLKREMERAKERATLRHKHTGKWAKRMRNRDDVDDETREGLENMLSRGEKLRRRIQGVASDQSDQDDSDDESNGGSGIEENITRIKQAAFDELAKLGNEEPPEDDEKNKGKSIFEMKFMKDAMARQAAAVNKEVDDFEREMGGIAEDGSEKEATGSQEPDVQSGAIVIRSGGRISYRPGDSSNLLVKTNSVAQPPSVASSVTLKSTDVLSPPPPSPSPAKQLPSSLHVPEEINPWLVRDKHQAGKVARSKNSVVVSKDSKALDKAKHRIGKVKSKTQEGQATALEDSVLHISMDNVLRLPTNSISDVLQEEDEQGSGEESEIEVQENALVSNGKEKTGVTFRQRDLVALAFAGDNVVQSFEEAKRREITVDAPHAVDTTIPGWGAWGGAGMKRAHPKPERIKVVPGIDPATRADHGKKNIIISEKRDKKVAKYLVKDLPYPYTSKAQFERGMDNPLGTEWNTRVGFQRGTLPRVVKKPGVIIEPLLKIS